MQRRKPHHQGLLCFWGKERTIEYCSEAMRLLANRITAVEVS